MAQDFDEAPFLYFDIDTGLRYEENDPGEDEFSFDTVLGVGFYTATAARRLSFEASILAQTLADEAIFTDPTLSFSYAAFDRGTEISFDLDYTATDLDDTALDDDFDADDLANDGGRRERLSAELGLLTGRNAPFGTDTDLRYQRTLFSGGTDDDDETLLSASTALRFTLSPLVTLRATGFLSRTEEEDAANTVETIYRHGFGADLLIDRAWSANLDFGYRQTETESDVMGVRVSNVVGGLEAGLSVTRDLRNGALTFSIDRSVVTTGFEDTVSARRNLALANGAEVAASFGFVIFEGADPVAIYSASYANEIRRGSRLTLGLDRTGGVSDDDENIIRTRLSAELVQDLTRNSSLSLDASLLQAEDASLAGTDTSRFNVGLAYRHALTADWNLAARASHQILYEDGVVDDRVTVVSLGIERRFLFRP